MFNKIRKAVAVGASMGLVALGIGALSTTSLADNTIDPNATYTITVHAQKGPADTSKPPTGKEMNTGKDPIQGAKFKLEKSKNSVTTAAGYAKAKAGDFGEVDTTFTGGAEKETGSDGTVAFTGLKPGFYRLTQTAAPTGMSPVKVSYILVPLTDPDTGTYMENIHVYPKSNDAGKVSKKDITPETGLVTKGSKMLFQIDSPIRTLADNHKFDKFVVTDTPVSGIEVAGDKGTVKMVQIVKVQDTPAAADDITLDAADYQVSDSGTKKVVTLTTTGLAKVSDNQGKFLRVVIEGTVTADVTDKVTNTADVANKGDDESTDTKVETPGGDDTPTTLMGKIKILKYKTGTEEELTGGKFEVYACGADQGISGDKLTIDAKSQFDAKEVISPIRAMENNQLCVKEVVAPKGYELDPAPTKVDFTAAAIKAAPDSTVEVKIYNEPTSNFTAKLPLTGGAGILLFLLIGGALLGSSYYRARKSEARAE